MLWVYDKFNSLKCFSAGVDFRRQNLTSKVGPRTEGVKKGGMLQFIEVWHHGCRPGVSVSIFFSSR